ncbi:MAG: hypothetical protein Q4B80_01855 [Aerococcaceae bacterium]|nr:hypothetical protein [Aerococcaceae bacterium]
MPIVIDFDDNSYTTYQLDYQILSNYIIRCISQNPYARKNDIQGYINEWLHLLQSAEIVDMNYFIALSNEQKTELYNNEMFITSANLNEMPYYLHFNVDYILKNLNTYTTSDLTIHKDNQQLIQQLLVIDPRSHDLYKPVKSDPVLLIDFFYMNQKLLIIDGNQRYKRFLKTDRQYIETNLLHFSLSLSSAFIFCTDFILYFLFMETALYSLDKQLFSRSKQARKYIETLLRYKRSSLN